AYRQTFNPACTAQLQSGIATLGAGDTPASVDAMSSIIAPPASATPIPVPQLRPSAQGEDPETLADRVGGPPPPARQVVNSMSRTENGIRIGGAEYYESILRQQAAPASKGRAETGGAEPPDPADVLTQPTQSGPSPDHPGQGPRGGESPL